MSDTPPSDSWGGQRGCRELPFLLQSPGKMKALRRFVTSARLLYSLSLYSPDVYQGLVSISQWFENGQQPSFAVESHRADVVFLEHRRLRTGW